MAFHGVQEHQKRSLDEEIMTVRSWRLPINSDYKHNQQGLLIFIIFGPNMSSNFIKIYIDGFYTQRSFHRVQEHSKRSSDEEIMTVRS